MLQHFYRDKTTQAHIDMNPIKGQCSALFVLIT